MVSSHSRGRWSFGSLRMDPGERCQKQQVGLVRSYPVSLAFVLGLPDICGQAPPREFVRKV